MYEKYVALLGSGKGKNTIRTKFGTTQKVALVEVQNKLQEC
jgi:hypothetical protein